MAMFERITIPVPTDAGIRSRTFDVRVLSEASGRVTAVKVRKDGTEIGEDLDQRHMVIFDADEATKRIPLRINLHFGTLEVAKEGKIDVGCQ